MLLIVHYSWFNLFNHRHGSTSLVEEALMVWVVGVNRRPDHGGSGVVSVGVGIGVVVGAGAGVVGLRVVSPQALMLLIDVELLLVHSLLHLCLPFLSFHHRMHMLFLHLLLLSDDVLLDPQLPFLVLPIYPVKITHLNQYILEK
jgi:hypothetical protein